MGLNKVVDFSTANLLKEKGFDIPTRQRYFIAEKIDSAKFPNLQVDCALHNWNEYDDSSTSYYSAPTIAEVIMWLYEKHRVWIDVSLTDNSRHMYFDYTIITSNDRDYNDEDCFDSAKRIYDKDKHSSPTEAYLTAIEYTLKNLI